MHASPQPVGVICDPHPIWLDAVEQVLQRAGVRVVGKTTSTAEARSLVEEHRPDLLVTALNGADGELSGMALLRSTYAAVPTTRAIALSVHQDAELIDAALEAGAAAYVVKTARPEDLASAIRQVFSQSVYVAVRPSVPPEGGAGTVDGDADLTRREVEILRLTAEGYPNAELARMLWVTEQTVKFHLSNIYRKLRVANRTEASRWAQLHGLLDGRPSDQRDVSTPGGAVAEPEPTPAGPMRTGTMAACSARRSRTSSRS
jgi:DNA-binding NarL/FixJ family response regulator